jgi:hypothetical protein
MAKFEHHAVCDECWTDVLHRTDDPYRMADPKIEHCCWCGQDTFSGIYIRERDAPRCQGHT